MQERAPFSPHESRRLVSEPAPELLAAEGLTVERGGRIVLKDLAFALAPGETILVAGRNGAGKSTLLRALAGLLHPESGTIRYGRADDDVRGVETVHYLGYEDALKPSLTVRENLEFWASMLGPSSPVKRGRGTARSVVEGARAADTVSGNGEARQPPPPPAAGPPPRCAGEDIPGALEAYGVARLIDLSAGYLSAGQKRRVALARLLLAPRPIWLLDEPLIALDTAAQDLVVAHMAAHTAAGGAILVASHQPLSATRTLDLDAGA